MTIGHIKYPRAHNKPSSRPCNHPQLNKFSTCTEDRDFIGHCKQHHFNTYEWILRGSREAPFSILRDGTISWVWKRLIYNVKHKNDVDTLHVSLQILCLQPLCLVPSTTFWFFELKSENQILVKTGAKGEKGHRSITLDVLRIKSLLDIVNNNIISIPINEY